MADQSESSSKSNPNSLASARLEHTTAHELETQCQETGSKSPSNQVKSETPAAQIMQDSTEKKPTKSSGQTSQKTASKIPVKLSGKQSEKNKDSSATKKTNTTAMAQDENSTKIGKNSSKIDHSNFEIGHNRSKTEPIIPTIHENSALKSREMLENELLFRSNQVESLQKQLDVLKQASSVETRPEILTENEVNFATKFQTDGTTSQSQGQFKIPYFIQYTLIDLSFLTVHCIRRYSSNIYSNFGPYLVKINIVQYSIRFILKFVNKF